MKYDESFDEDSGHFDESFDAFFLTGNFLGLDMNDMDFGEF